MPGDKLYLVSKFNELEKNGEKLFIEHKSMVNFEEEKEKNNLLYNISHCLFY
jgi:hypothetical protein